MLTMLKKVFSFIWQALNGLRRLVMSLLVLVIVVAIISSLGEDKGPEVPKDGALVLNLDGVLVEKAKQVDPFKAVTQELQGSSEPPEMQMSDVLDVIKNAKDDNRIKMLVLKLGGLYTSSPDKLMTIGDAIEDFKKSGKQVVAIGDYYTQGQYLLAAYANKVYLNKDGFMSIDGFGRYRLYYKSLLDKLKVTTHVFRVGTFKSAVEPYIRDDMSDAAKDANRTFLNALWGQYQDKIVALRHLKAGALDDMLNNLPERFAAAGSDFAQLALKEGLVDKLMTRNDMEQALIADVGENDEHSFRHISYDDYLSIIHPKFDVPKKGPKVGVIVAQGEIVDGTAPVNMSGGDSIAALIRQARFDKDIKAVVLRVDSPGGSAFASEIIHQELLALKKAGKPVVVSMGTYAASGGYWISASADEIIAHPTTLTGSIGIFGMLATFENSLDAIGVHSDGVGTSEYAGTTLTRPLSDNLKKIIQGNVEKGYDRFLTLVAKNRHMSKEDVNKIAQGHIWIGTQAKKLGLVDKLGDEQLAIKDAAKMANLTHYSVENVVKKLTPKQQFIQTIFGDAAQMAASVQTQKYPWLSKILASLDSDVSPLVDMKDPQGMYMYCRDCNFN
ncbi:signal peptide peptidase SppA [Gallaecimonas mangrovi]|uniref:signal peptide peptidase SppA n=1 Tax=Gallaecimonas mangrovi TaxID=2291597 RepID=UPI000E209ED2|nr:signal peptide peptidase SppA [Gallaecimonas mangrovi]